MGLFDLFILNKEQRRLEKLLRKTRVDLSIIIEHKRKDKKLIDAYELEFDKKYYPDIAEEKKIDKTNREKSDKIFGIKRKSIEEFPSREEMSKFYTTTGKKMSEEDYLKAKKEYEKGDLSYSRTMMGKLITFAEVPNEKKKIEDYRKRFFEMKPKNLDCRLNISVMWVGALSRDDLKLLQENGYIPI